MNFDLNDEQQEIKRTAHEFLASRFKPEKVRELAEARSYDDGLWKEISELGWPGIAISEDDGGQGLGMVELAVLLRGVRLRLRARARCSARAGAALVISAAGSDEQRAEWLPKLASGEATGSFGGFADGREHPLLRPADRRRGRHLRRRAARCSRRPPRSTSSPSRRSTRPAPTGWSPSAAGERAARRRRRRPRPARRRDRRGAHRDRPAGDGDGRRVRARAPAVRPADRRLPGASATAARRCCSPPRSLARSPTTPPGPPTPSPSRCRWPPRWPGARSADAGWQVPASALQVFGGIGFTWEHDLQFWLKRGRVAGRMLGTPRDHRERVADLSGLGAGEPAAV